MQFKFNYDKAKVIQALRYHFIAQKEIKVLLVVVNVFAVTAAFLFFLQKVRPEPFLLSAFLWLLLLTSVWYILPYNIYNKTESFKQNFNVNFTEEVIILENNLGKVNWSWDRFTHFMESPNFFHLYFNTKSFFIIPKDDLPEEDRHELRAMIKVLIPNNKY